MEASEITKAAFWVARRSRVLAPPQLAEEGAWIGRRLGDSASLVFASSGSGGVPKWTRLRREALLASAGAVNAHLGVTAGDTWMLALPLYHVGGFGVAARAYVAGCALRRFAGRWDAMRFAEELEEAGATHTSLVPTQVQDLIACELRGPESLRAVVVGGAKLSEAAGEDARALGWPLLQSYGMTETASQVATAPLSALEAEFTAGPLPVLPIWEHRVGEDGCLELRGAALFEAYLWVEEGRLHEEGRLDRWGWFRTSDRVELSAEGVTVLGRADRQVKILGELVDVEAIEEELRAHLAGEGGLHILQVPDQRRGWRLVPVIEGEGSGAEDLVEVVNERLPGFARLESPRFVRKLPRTALGKVDVARLGEEVAGPES